jgi:hypothetical protein
LYSLKNILLFSVILYICSLSLYFSKPFSTMIVRYSFSCAYMVEMPCTLFLSG